MCVKLKEKGSSTTFAEPLLHKGRTFTTNRGKANAFMKEYTAVNRLRFYKEERNRIRQLKSTLKSPTAATPVELNICDRFVLSQI